ncbi:MAG TPA: copper resistance system multicopper oxidase [Micropepsaceae bacterium]|nr:copper resistance system multicopper oxidase [Micropepsaceae bacterium]
MNDVPAVPPGFSLSRRHLVEGLALVAGTASVGWPLKAFAAAAGPQTLTGNRFDLSVGTMPINITGRPRIATAVNGSVPAPILRFKEGETVTINVTNRLGEPTSIHWHGIKLPNAMDGVPGLTFKGIMPGETFTYRFPIIQSGTYWYHSHSGMQEQTGLYGPLILEPRGREAYAYDRDYVIMLSDWTDEDPMAIVSNLKQQGDYYNYGQRTPGTFVDDAKRDGLGPTIRDRMMWGKMRMSPTDIMDVTGSTYTFLINGQPPAANWTGLFSKGERVRLRFINGSSMSTFDIRIPGLNMTVVQADGTDVEPVEVEEFRIGVAETYDVIVAPDADAYTIFAQAQDRSGYARATLAKRDGLAAAIPPMDPRPMRTMNDMGMGDMAGMDNMSGMSSGSSTPGMDMSGATPLAAPASSSSSPMPGMDMGSGSTANMPGMAPAKPAPEAMPGMDMSHGSMPTQNMAPIPSSNADGIDPKTLEGNPSVDNVAMSTKNRLAEAGDGLDGNGRKVLTYADLNALTMLDGGPPTREIEFHLTGNMERWTWGFDGKRFSEAGPIPVKLNERVRFVLINDTMMEHPIHLHGFLFQVENGKPNLPFKHTINVKPGEKMSFVFTADTPGYWAFHCHLLYHMEMGMFRTVVVS